MGLDLLNKLAQNFSTGFLQNRSDYKFNLEACKYDVTPKRIN